MKPRNGKNRIKKAAGYLHACAGFLAHSDKSFGSPVSCFIEPTNLCNLRCPLCAAGSGELRRSRGSMGIDRFEHIIGNLPSGITDLYLWGQGEPFIAPDFLSMVRLASGRGFRTVVSTNGHFLDNPEDIVESGLHTLIVSLDGVDTETYESYRIGGSYQKVMEGIRGVSELAVRQMSGPEIELQCVVNSHNEKNLAQFKTIARSLGASRTVFKTLQVSSLSEGESSHSYLPNDPKLTRYRKNKSGKEIRLETDRRMALRSRCLRLYYSLQIDWEGNVVPCCFDKNSEYIVGNLLCESFETIWNGERFRSFRNGLNRRGRVLPMCRNCTEGLRRMNIHA
jgi:radical SAM protein with 4Fe4S-binding SPASM domain